MNRTQKRNRLEVRLAEILTSVGDDGTWTNEKRLFEFGTGYGDAGYCVVERTRVPGGFAFLFSWHHCERFEGVDEYLASPRHAS